MSLGAYYVYDDMRLQLSGHFSRFNSEVQKEEEKD